MDLKFVFDKNNLFIPKFEENSEYLAFESGSPNRDFDSILSESNSNDKFDESIFFAKSSFLIFLN